MLGRNSKNKFQNDVAGATRTNRKGCSGPAAGAQTLPSELGCEERAETWQAGGRVPAGQGAASGVWSGEPQSAAALGVGHSALCVELMFAFYSVTN